MQWNEEKVTRLMPSPGIEPGSARPQRAVLTTILQRPRCGVIQQQYLKHCSFFQEFNNNICIGADENPYSVAFMHFCPQKLEFASLITANNLEKIGQSKRGG